VPVTIKEQFWIQGKKSTLNAAMHKDFVAPEDAIIGDRIRRSGAVILGHTNVCRMLVDYQVWRDICPEGKNPYNTEHTPGGSTGGGAAALAAGFSALELGGGLGGSIRVPATPTAPRALRARPGAGPAAAVLSGPGPAQEGQGPAKGKGPPIYVEPGGAARQRSPTPWMRSLLIQGSPSRRTGARRRNARRGDRAARGEFAPAP
jgi:hypothetical protein